MLNVCSTVFYFLLLKMIFRRKSFMIQNIVGIPDQMIYCVSNFTKMGEFLFIIIRFKTIVFILLKAQPKTITWKFHKKVYL